MQLLSYLQTWELSAPQPLAQTATSVLYRVRWNQQDVVLKMLTPVGVQDERAGGLALQYFDGQGAVRLLRHDDKAQLLEYVGGEDAKSLVLRGQDVEATRVIAEVLSRLH